MEKQDCAREPAGETQQAITQAAEKAFPHKHCGSYNECRSADTCLDSWRCSYGYIDVEAMLNEVAKASEPSSITVDYVRVRDASAKGDSADSQ